MRRCLVASLSVAALLSVSAHAGERSPHPGYVGAGEGGYNGYAFADGAVSGAYVGAPYTRFPKPGAIVPPAWGYGTYGVPTMTGIRQAPVGDPRIYVIQGTGPRAARGRGQTASDTAAASGPRVVPVRVRRD